MKKLLVAALAVVLATPAFAAIQNVKVSGDITESYLNDYKLGLRTPVDPTNQYKQSVFLSQVRLRVDADLSDNVSTQVGLINERAWNAEGNAPNVSGYDTNVQVYLANITLREFLYSPLTLVVGRQVFNYGNGLILGDGGPINSAAGDFASIYAGLTQRTAYDGVKAILDYKPLTIDLIYFKNYQGLATVQGQNVGGAKYSSDVFGYNANYQLSDPWSTVVEQYVFARVNGNGLASNIGAAGSVSGVGTIADKSSTLYVPGLRASTNPIKGLNVQGEVAWQLGKQVVNLGGVQEAENRNAMALQLMGSYSLPVLQKYKPTVNASFTHVSGDKNSNTNASGNNVKSAKSFSAWDEFNSIQGAGTIYRAILPLSNENIISFGGSVSPLEDVTVGATWTSLWAVERISGQNPLYLIQPNGTTSVLAATKNHDKGLGNEADVNVTYNYTEDVTFGLSLGWFVPGSVFSNTYSSNASQAIASLGVKF